MAAGNGPAHRRPGGCASGWSPASDGRASRARAPHRRATIAPPRDRRTGDPADRLAYMVPDVLRHRWSRDGAALTVMW
jgi:hypothetical protein